VEKVIAPLVGYFSLSFDQAMATNTVANIAYCIVAT
jgi:hypothetical protein